MRPFATRGYVDGKCADLAVRLRHKPVISVTATPAMVGSVANHFGFNEGRGRVAFHGYYTMAAGRIIRICLFTQSHENMSIGSQD